MFHSRLADQDLIAVYDRITGTFQQNVLAVADGDAGIVDLYDVHGLEKPKMAHEAPVAIGLRVEHQAFLE